MRSLTARIHLKGRIRDMLPYEENTKKLEDLLQKLFEDDDDIAVLERGLESTTYTNCCTYTYGSF